MDMLMWRGLVTPTTTCKKGSYRKLTDKGIDSGIVKINFVRNCNRNSKRAILINVDKIDWIVSSIDQFHKAKSDMLCKGAEA